MRLKTERIGFICCLFFSLLSCGEDDREECIGYENAPITKVSGPSTAEPGETVSFEVDFYMRNGCGAFERLVETKAEFTRMIAVEAKYEGCLCTQNILYDSVLYHFTPDKAGDYEINFRTVNEGYIVKHLVVE